jgi:hypothetical protein
MGFQGSRWDASMKMSITLSVSSEKVPCTCP